MGKRPIGLAASILLVVTLLVPTAAAGQHARAPVRATISCAGATTLELLVECIRGHMPLEGSDAFVIPDAAQQTDFRDVVRQMLDGQCEAIPLPQSLSDAYTVRTFADADDAKSYCVLMEVGAADPAGHVDLGWGTFLTNSAPLRELNVAIAHPIADAGTESQGIGVFKGSESRTFLLAGTHRRANRDASPCQGAFSVSDVAHNVANMFFAATQELISWYGTTSFVQLQFHGSAASTCPGVDVYMTHGLAVPPASDDAVSVLKANALRFNPAWSVTVPGDTPPCSLNGTNNVEGRLLNGVPAAQCCDTSATTYTQRFIHIEQAPGFRDAADWIPVVNATWPAAAAAQRRGESSRLSS